MLKNEYIYLIIAPMLFVLLVWPSYIQDILIAIYMLMITIYNL